MNAPQRAVQRKTSDLLEQPCPFCGQRGRVASAATVGLRILEELEIQAARTSQPILTEVCLALVHRQKPAAGILPLRLYPIFLHSQLSVTLEQQLLAQPPLQTLEKALQSDPVKTNVLGLTQLGLVELTRKKMRAPLSDVLGQPSLPSRRSKSASCFPFSPTSQAATAG